MLKNTAKNNQSNLFHSPLSDMLDMNDPLIALSHEIDWNNFDESFKKYYTLDNGRPGKPIRLMI